MKRLLYLTLCTFLMALQLLIVKYAHAKDVPPAFEKLVSRLYKDGMDKQYLRDIFTRPELELMPETVAKSLVRKEACLNYAQFLEKYAVNKSLSYLKTHERSLKKIEGYFGVSAPVVVAILSVETACGTYLGRFNAVNILVTKALSLDPEIYRQIYEQIPPEEKQFLSHQNIKKKLRKKSTIAYRELKALLTYTRSHKIDPLSIKGSSEGAIGIPQFLPSNIKRYGYDGNGDGKIDLFQHEDAIASVASFLKAYRWSEDRSYQKKKSIIHRYNSSNYYASTVLTLAEKLNHYW